MTRIRLIGTGNILSASNNASVLMDDALLIDCGNGVVKAMLKQGIDLGRIEALLVTHLHGDHFSDVLELIMCRAFAGVDRKLDIYGPEGLEEAVYELCRICFADICDEFSNLVDRAKVNFKSFDELEDIKGYDVEAYKMLHNGMSAYGYLIKKDGLAVAVSGDTGRCDNLDAMIERCDVAILEMTGIEENESHLCVNDIKYYEDRYKKDIIVTHMSDKAKEMANTMEHRFLVPEDGSTYEYKKGRL